jgi:hypothetical protein
VVDDVHGSALDDIERRLALAVPEDLVTPGERQLGADALQVLDLLSVSRGNIAGSSGSRKSSTGVGE